jgi:hypothetical protein
MKYLITLIFICFYQISFTQNVTGWYVVTDGCEWGMLSPSATDVSGTLTEGQTIKKETIDDFIDNPNKYKNSSLLSEGEVVFVINKISDVFYCYTVVGRMVALKGNPLKVEPGNNTGIGVLNEEITLLNGKTIRCDCVWIIGQDLAKQTVTIQFGANEKYEIPQSKCELLNPILVNTAKALKWKKVE